VFGVWFGDTLRLLFKLVVVRFALSISQFIGHLLTRICWLDTALKSMRQG
jgi:hypothetical protein